MDDGIPIAKKRRNSESEAGERKVINVDAAIVDAVNDYAEDLEDKLGFRPTFSQTLRYIVKELKKK